jgi:hypothetical protein
LIQARYRADSEGAAARNEITDTDFFNTIDPLRTLSVADTFHRDGSNMTLKGCGMKALPGLFTLAAVSACDWVSNTAPEPKNVRTAFSEYEECIDREAARLGQMGSLSPAQANSVARRCRRLLPSGNAGAAAEAECSNIAQMSRQLPPC